VDKENIEIFYPTLIVWIQNYLEASNRGQEVQGECGYLVERVQDRYYENPCG